MGATVITVNELEAATVITVNELEAEDAQLHGSSLPQRPQNISKKKKKSQYIQQKQQDASTPIFPSQRSQNQSSIQNEEQSTHKQQKQQVKSVSNGNIKVDESHNDGNADDDQGKGSEKQNGRKAP